MLLCTVTNFLNMIELNNVYEYEVNTMKTNDVFKFARHVSDKEDQSSVAKYRMRIESCVLYYYCIF